MKIITLTLIAAVSAVAAASPALARDDRGWAYEDGCTNRIHGNGTAGALIGGLAGAAVGANLAAHHGGRTGGALLGAAAGAAVGNQIARSTTKGHCRGGSDRYYGYDRGYEPDYRDYGAYEHYHHGEHGQHGHHDDDDDDEY